MLLVALCVCRLFAQQDKLDLDRLEIPTPTSEPSVPYFSLGGGFIGMFLFPGLDALNAKTEQWQLGSFSRPLFLSGIEGVVTLGVIPNLRIGVFGIGGSKQLERSLSADTQRQAEFFLGATGFSVAYALVPVRSLAVLPTLSGGWGTIRLEFAQSPTRTRWDELAPGLGTASSLQRLSASYFFVHPQLYFEYAPLPFLMLRLGGGYQFSFVGEWKQNRIATTEGVPSGVNASGASAQFAIFVGLFN
jgi:hypothetical protein